MLSVITVYSILIIYFNLQFFIEFSLYQLLSSIYALRSTLYDRLSKLYQLLSALYALRFTIDPLPFKHNTLECL